MNDFDGDDEDDIEIIDIATPHLSQMEKPPDPKLVAEGWERRFMIDKRRVEEYKELYQSMGFEIRIEGVRNEEVDPECGDCALIMHQIFATLYTRRSGSSSQSG